MWGHIVGRLGIPLGDRWTQRPNGPLTVLRTTRDENSVKTVKV